MERESLTEIHQMELSSQPRIPFSAIRMNLSDVIAPVAAWTWPEPAAPTGRAFPCVGIGHRSMLPRSRLAWFTIQRFSAAIRAPMEDRLLFLSLDVNTFDVRILAAGSIFRTARLQFPPLCASGVRL